MSGTTEARDGGASSYDNNNNRSRRLAASVAVSGVEAEQITIK